MSIIFKQEHNPNITSFQTIIKTETIRYYSFKITEPLQSKIGRAAYIKNENSSPLLVAHQLIYNINRPNNSLHSGSTGPLRIVEFDIFLHNNKLLSTQTCALPKY